MTCSVLEILILLHFKPFCQIQKLWRYDEKILKNLENPTCIGHILINHQKSFHSSGVYETGLSVFHKLTLTALKVFFFTQNINLKSFSVEIQTRNTLTMHHLGQIFFRRCLFKMFSLENLKNWNTFCRKYLYSCPKKWETC